MKLRRVDHVGIVVNDLDTAKQFLTSLGLECSMDLQAAGSSHSAVFKCGDLSLVLVQMDDPTVNRKRLHGESQARIEHICFEIENLEETIGQLHDLKIRTTGAPYSQNGDTGTAPLQFGRTASVFTQAESSGGYVLQFIESKAGTIEDGLALENKRPRKG